MVKRNTENSNINRNESESIRPKMTYLESVKVSFLNKIEK